MYTVVSLYISLPPSLCPSPSHSLSLSLTSTLPNGSYKAYIVTYWHLQSAIGLRNEHSIDLLVDLITIKGFASATPKMMLKLRKIMVSDEVINAFLSDCAHLWAWQRTFFRKYAIASAVLHEHSTGRLRNLCEVQSYELMVISELLFNLNRFLIEKDRFVLSLHSHAVKNNRVWCLHRQCVRPA